MELIELLEIIDENDNVNVLDLNRETIARYDGRDNIPSVLNPCKVVKIEYDTDAISIMIDFIGGC